MSRSSQIQYLLCTAVAFIFSDAVAAGIIVVQSSSSSSSSSFETSCDGLVCPRGSSCMSYSNIANGNYTSDKRCTDKNGEVIKQETTTIVNGVRCIKKVNTVGDSVKVTRSCKKLKKDKNIKIHKINDFHVHDGIEEDLEHEQDALEAEIDREDDYIDSWSENHDRQRERKLSNLQSEMEYREMLDDLGTSNDEEAEMRRDSFDEYADDFEDDGERDAEEKERKQEQKLLRMERAKELLERRAETLERVMGKVEDSRNERLENIVEALYSIGKVKR